MGFIFLKTLKTRGDPVSKLNSLSDDIIFVYVNGGIVIGPAHPTTYVVSDVQRLISKSTLQQFLGTR